jgi:HK97 family phage prohead protease
MIRGLASTADWDRAGDSIEVDAWTKGGLKNFENNPIILFNHDYNRPIGRATKIVPTKDGLHLEAKISKAAKDVAELVKDGVLGAFSVGFRVKDADYIKETDGYLIKDAELFEVSVVSVPANQAATFSLSKSFDSVDEYRDYMSKTFKNSVDLAGQSLAKDENSEIASDTPDGENSQKEIKMSEENKTPEIDLDAFAKKVADETAAKMALKAAEEKAAAQKAAEEAEAVKAAEAQKEAEVKSAIEVGVTTGTERLMEEFKKEMEAKDANIEETLAKYKSDLEEKSAEIEAMRKSKRDLSGRKCGYFEDKKD